LFKRFRGCSQAEDQVEEAEEEEEEVVNFLWPSMRGTTRGLNHEGVRPEVQQDVQDCIASLRTLRVLQHV
jgi:hypothetical protein